jgi:predicted AAA+ superfamily ATPase
MHNFGLDEVLSLIEILRVGKNVSLCAVLIKGPKSCGKTETTTHYAKKRVENG